MEQLESPTKAWDWRKNTSEEWKKPSLESAGLAQRWRAQGRTRFLDLGCGLGRHSVYFAKEGFEVDAMDLSGYSIASTREWAAREGVQVRTHCGNMLTLPFPDNTFDCALAFHVIYHTDTQGVRRILSEMRRVLRNGAEWYLTLIAKENPGFRDAPQSRRMDENTVLRDDSDTERNVPHFYAGAQELERVLEGFAILEDPVREAQYSLRNAAYGTTHWKLLVRCEK